MNAKFNDIINQIKENRKEMHLRLKEITEHRKKLEVDIEKNNDYRKKWYSVETQKLICQNFETELKFLEKIDNSLETEFDMRRKMFEITEENDKELDPEKIAELTKIIAQRIEPNKMEIFYGSPEEK